MDTTTTTGPTLSPPARRKRELDPFMRTRICELKNTAKWSYSKIHEQYPNIPISTIKSTVRREKFRVNNQTAPRSGRPRKSKTEKATKLPAGCEIQTNDKQTYATIVQLIPSHERLEKELEESLRRRALENDEIVAQDQTNLEMS